MSTPQTTIYICSGVRLDSRYIHSIYFPTLAKQQEYFSGKVVRTFSDYSYVRKNWPLKVHATMAQAREWNYLYFQNPGNNKTYYYFINNVEYRNDTTVILNLELDVLQTYLFDWNLLHSFVERQHTETDVIGEHTVDEDVELGELVDNTVYDWGAVETLCILVTTTIDPNNTSGTPAFADMYDNVFSGLKVYAVPIGKWVTLGSRLSTLETAGVLDGIISMWMYPKALVNLADGETWDGDTLFKRVDGCGGAGSAITPAGCGNNLNGYTPKNKKLFTHPFNFLYATNNAGGSALFRYERFEDHEPRFLCVGSLSPEGSVKMYPQGYNGLSVSAEEGGYEYGLSLGGYPTCAWDSDVYKMWLAQNANTHHMVMQTSQFTSGYGVGTAAAGMILGNGGMVESGMHMAYDSFQQVSQLIAQRRDMQCQPPQAKGSFSANVNIVAKKQTFTFYRKSVSAERARVIDDYFTMYGYKLNRVQRPNINARPAFTYVKTVGCNIQGDMCTEDCVKIAQIFDRGVTWWTNGDRVADYTQNNTV